MGIFDFFKRKTSEKDNGASVDAPVAAQPQDDDESQGKPTGLAPLQPIQIEKQSREMFFNVLASVIKAYGEGFIEDKRFISTMADYGAFSQDFRYKAILKAIISEGYIVRITSTTIAKSQYDSIFTPFIKEHSFGKDETYYVVENLTKVLSSGTSRSNTRNNSSNSGAPQRIIPEEFVSVTYKDLAIFEKRMASDGAVENVNFLNEDHRLIRLFERLYIDIGLLNEAIEEVRRKDYPKLSISNISYGIKHDSYIEYPDKSNGLDHPRRSNKAKFHFSFELSGNDSNRLEFLLMGLDKSGRIVRIEHGGKMESGKAQDKLFRFCDPVLRAQKVIYLQNCDYLMLENSQRGMKDVERFIIVPIPERIGYRLPEKFRVPSGYVDIKHLFDIRDFMWDIFKYIQILAYEKKVFFFYVIDTHKQINPDAHYELEAIRGLPESFALEVYDDSDNKIGWAGARMDEDIYKAYLPFTPLFDPEHKCDKHTRKLRYGTMNLPVPVEQIAKIVYLDQTRK